MIKIKKEDGIKLPIPMRMHINYLIENINHRTIEKYETEILFKKEMTLTKAMHDLKYKLDEFCNECEGSLDAIVKHQLEKK